MENTMQLHEKFSKEEEDRITREWIMREGPKYDPAFGSSTSYDINQRALQNAKLLPISKDDKFNRLREVLLCYLACAGDEAAVRFNGDTTWEDVFATANQAIEQKQMQKSRLSRFFNKTGYYGPAVMNKINAAPQNDYVSIVCCGLKIVIGAAMHMEKKKTQIMDALLELPIRVHRVEGFLSVFPYDTTLTKLVDDLYTVFIETISKSIEWVVDKQTWRKITAAVVLGPMISQPLADLLSDVSRKATVIDDHVEISKTRSLKQSTDDGLAIRLSTNRLEANDARIINDVGQLQESFMDISRKLDREATARAKQEEAGVIAKDSVFLLLKDEFHKVAKAESEAKHYRQENEKLKQELLHVRLQASSGLIRQEEMLAFMAVQEATAGKGLIHVIRQANTMDRTAVSMGQSVFESTEFKAWLGPEPVQILFVTEYRAISGPNRIAPLSVMTAMLVSSFEESAGILPLHFFCGLHTASQDHLAGPGQRSAWMDAIRSPLDLVRKVSTDWI